MRHSRLAALGLMAALAFAIPIASFAASQPDTEFGLQPETNYALTNLTTDQTVADQHNAVLRDDIGIATAYAEDLGLTNDWIITTRANVALSATTDPGGYAIDTLNVTGLGDGMLNGYVYTIDNATRAVVVSSTSSARAGLSLDMTFANFGNDGGSGLAYNDTPAVARVCSYVGPTDYAQASLESGAGNHALLHT